MIKRCIKGELLYVEYLQVQALHGEWIPAWNKYSQHVDGVTLSDGTVIPPCPACKGADGRHTQPLTQPKINNRD